jgi:hypothetical protein
MQCARVWRELRAESEPEIFKEWDGTITPKQILNDVYGCALDWNGLTSRPVVQSFKQDHKRYEAKKFREQKVWLLYLSDHQLLKEYFTPLCSLIFTSALYKYVQQNTDFSFSRRRAWRWLSSGMYRSGTDRRFKGACCLLRQEIAPHDESRKHLWNVRKLTYSKTAIVRT